MNNEMDSYQLLIKANYRLGVLERILRVVRHRGGHINAMSMQQEDNQCLSLTLQMANTKPKNLISSQLIKLSDIIEVS